MKNKVKEKISLICGVIGVVIVLAILIFFGFKNQNIARNSSDKISKLNYVLVNEDEGAYFDDKSYNLGTDFIRLVNQDNKNNWETTSYSLANAGFKNGQYNVEIIIPHDFSKRLLALDSIDPKKALIEYKVQRGQNEISNKEVQEQINAILKNFNQRIIKMYFSSIIDNLSEAQENVGRIVGENNQNYRAIESQIYSPLSVLPDEYNTLLDTTSILKEGNDEFNDSQKEFVDTIRERLLGTSGELKDSDGEVTELQKEIQNTMAEEAKTANDAYEEALKEIDAKEKLVTEQWKKDKTHYKDLASSTSKITQEQLKQMGDSNHGQLALLIGNINQFQENQNKCLEQLGSAINQLETQRKELINNQKSFAQTYYGAEDRTPDTVTDDELKEALQQLLSNGTQTSELYDKYKKVLDEDIEKLPLDKLDKVLKYLVDTRQISKEDESRYHMEIDMIKRYTDQYDRETNDLYTENEISEDDFVSKDNRVTLTIDPSKENILTIAPNDNQYSMALSNIEFDALKKQLNEQLEPYHYLIEDLKVDGNKIIVGKAKNTSDADDSQPEDISLPSKISMVMNFDVKISTSEKEDEMNIPYKWISNVLGEESTGLCVIQHGLGIVLNMPKIMNVLSLLDQSSQILTNLYGNPGDNIEQYTKYLSEHDGTVKEIASKDSLYYLYTHTFKDGGITEDVLKRYKKNVDDLYNKMSHQIEQMSLVIGNPSSNQETGTLYSIYQALTRPDDMVEQVKSLQSAYHSAVKTINDAYDQWEDSEQEDNHSSISREHPLNGDSNQLSQNADSVGETLRSLMESSKTLANDTQNEADNVRNISPEIKTLNQTTKEINKKTKGLVGNTDQLLKESGSQNKNNNTYSKNFNGVLANAKNGGSDNPAVFNFLSNPLIVEGKLGELNDKKMPSLVPYYATLIGSIIAFAISLLLSGHMKKRQLDEEHQLSEHTRAWENIPNMILIGVSTLVVSLVYSGLLTLVLKHQNPSAALFGYTLLIEMGMILMITAGMRSYKKTTMSICMILFGLFVMLTPLLGVTVQHGTLTYWIYRFSPLQNMQGGFTAIINGLHIGVFSYIFLVAVVIGGVILNLLVPANSMDEGEMNE